jgi:hypothetical protein
LVSFVFLFDFTIFFFQWYHRNSFFSMNFKTSHMHTFIHSFVHSIYHSLYLLLNCLFISLHQWLNNEKKKILMWIVDFFLERTDCENLEQRQRSENVMELTPITSEDSNWYIS